MKRVSQGLLLFFFIIFLVGAMWAIRHALDLPFRSTNDALHKEDSSFDLDFMIPAGTYLDEKATIGEVLRLRFRGQTSLCGRAAHAVSELIPPRYRAFADLALFSFWFFCFMCFLRVFTFAGYGRALRGSLFLAGLTYYFMPDFSPGRIDDAVFIVIPALIILLRIWLHPRKKERIRET